MSGSEDAGRRDEIRARDIMQTHVTTVSYAAPIAELEGLLEDHRISGVPVVDEAGRIIGVVSLRDLVTHYAEEPDAHRPRTVGYYHVATDDEELYQADLDTLNVPPGDTVQAIMTSQVHAVHADALLSEISATMVKQGIHRVLVEEKGKCVGLISTMEILKALAEG
ncbi:MAG: CBS domain-containing protein [Planctomycetota bacterium]|jgi:CBS domain-containing protein